MIYASFLIEKNAKYSKKCGALHHCVKVQSVTIYTFVTYSLIAINSDKITLHNFQKRKLYTI